MTTTQTIDSIDTLKSRLKTTWTSGNYDRFARMMETSAVEFLDRLDVSAGARLLDVACGAGQLALIAARRGIDTTGVDIAPNWIAAARARAAAEGLSIRFDEGDAEALPYPDASFDVVATIYGAMFAPRPDLVAAELARVCRPGGMIAMANWTPEGFIGRMFRTIAQFIAPPGMPSPVLWGREDVVLERLAPRVDRLRLTRVVYRFNFPFGPSDVVDFFRQNYGPTARAFETLEEPQRSALNDALVELWTSHNVSPDPSRTVVDAEYLEVVARR